MKYLKSLFELVALTYAVTFLGIVTAAGFDITDLSSVRAAAVAGIPAVLAVVYGVVARALGNLNSALVVDTRDERFTLPEK